MNIDELVTRNKGPLIAIGGAAGGLVVLIIISAWVNMPSDINFGQILVNLIWLIFIVGLVVAGILYAKERFDGEYFETEEDPYLEDEVLVERPLVTPSVPQSTVPGMTETLEKKKKLVELFGTADLNQITLGVSAIYAELEGLREKGGSEQKEEDGSIITKLTSALEKEQSVSARWEKKAISSTQEVAKLRQELREHGKWEVVDEEQLTAFFPTITLGEGEEPFLASSRRQRRLMQRLSAEGYSIRKREVN